MFVKKDYLEYFTKIIEIERTMKREGEYLLKKVSDAKAKAILRKLVADERRHIKIVEGIIQIVKKSKANL